MRKNQREAVEGCGHLTVGVELFVFRGRRVPIEEQKLLRIRPIPFAPASTAAAASAALPMLATTSTRCTVGKDGRLIPGRIFLVAAVRHVDLKALGRLDIFRAWLNVSLPAEPSKIHKVPVFTSRAAAPAPTTQGMSSERAIIAVWAVGPPDAVHRPKMRFGSSCAVSEGVRSSAERITGSSGRRGAPCSAPASKRRTRCPISCKSAARSARRSFSICLSSTDRRSIACCQDHARCGRFQSGCNFQKNLGVVQKRQMSPKNRRFPFSGLAFDLLVNLRNLFVGRRDGPFQRKFLRGNIF